MNDVEVNQNSNNNEVLINHISKFITLFNETTTSKQYFSGYIEKFNRIKYKLENHKVEVGVIGITSSGKSTLLNAILGEKLLPQKVRPSSSVQIICGYGKELKAEIIFSEKSKKETKILYSNIKTELERYGDEEKNSMNALDVEEIHLFSPNYKLCKNILLIDTPGLDAYGMEYHEEITLRLVIPSVQVILFLTTVKSSSDQKNIELIDLITREDKPILIVQNMIDSIIPKENNKGIIKTEEEIQAEHLNRISKLLKKAQKRTVQEAPIIQISALLAENNWEASGISRFVESLDKIVIASNPQRIFLFYKQISNELKNIIKKLNDNENKQIVHEEQITYLNKIETDVKKIETEIETYSTDLNQNKELLSKRVKKVYNEIEEKYRDNKYPELLKSEYKEEIEDIFKGIKSINRELSKLIENIQERKDKIKNKLNLQNIDIEKRQNINYFSPSFTLSTKAKTETKTYLEEKNGFINRIFREIRIGGYYEKEYEVVIEQIDIERTLQTLITNFSKWISFLESIVPKFMNNTKYSITVFKKEITLKREIENIQLSNTIDNILSEKIKKEIILFLKENKANMTTYNCPINSSTRSADKYFESDCSKISVNLFKLAKYRSLLILYAFRDKIIEKTNKSNNIVVWGWDYHNINIFLDLFCSDITEFQLNKDDFKKIIKLNDSKYKSIIIINESNIDEPIDLNNLKEAVFFVVINTIQIGSTENKLKTSELLKIKNEHIIWVMDSLKELVSQQQDILIEAFSELLKILQSENINISSFLINDKNLYYSVLLNELFFNSSNWKLRNKKLEFLKNMKETFNLKNSMIDKTDSYIQQFKLLNE